MMTQIHLENGTGIGITDRASKEEGIINEIQKREAVSSG